MGDHALGIAMVFAAAVATLVAVRALMGRLPVPKRLIPRPGSFGELARRFVSGDPALLGPGQGSSSAPSQWGRGQHAGTTDGSAWVEGAAWGAAVVDGAVPAAEVWWTWSSVDHHVFQAVEHMTHEQVHGFADLLRVVDAKHYALETTGFFNKLVGHVGEWHVHEHLIDAGHAVAMPIGSNEPGLDMWVDGHPADVKLWADAGRAAGSHFADHPNIPLIVPHDVAHIPADALHFDPAHFDPAVLHGTDHFVLVDHALSHADVVSQTHDAVDALQNPGPHAHIPWVTFAVSTVRETRLLIKGHTDIVRAGKNVTVDVAAVGGVGALGLKGGALIGAAIGGPVGAVVGGVVGGFAGAVAGRKTANAIRRQPLVNAKAFYERAVDVYHREEEQAITYAATEWASAQSQEQARLSEAVGSLRDGHERITNGIRQRSTLATILPQQVADQLRAMAEADLDAEVERARLELRAACPRVFVLLPFLVSRRLYAQWRTLRRDVAAWRRRSAGMLRAWSGTPEWTAAFWDELLVAPKMTATATAFVQNSMVIRQQCHSSLAGACHHLLSALVEVRRRAAQGLRARWDVIQTAVAETLGPTVHSVGTAADCYRAELRKAGVDV